MELKTELHLIYFLNYCNKKKCSSKVIYEENKTKIGLCNSEIPACYKCFECDK